MPDPDAWQAVWPWRGGVLDAQGLIGAAERTILLNATAIMLAVIVPVIALTLAFAWWFRAGNRKAHYLPDWSYSGRIEVVVWSIPTLVVVFLGGIAWIGSHDLDPAMAIHSDTPPINIQVVSMDWKWLFIYPDMGVASVNRLVAPAGAPISFRLTSASVMNSFFVPQLGSQIYTMAGMATRLNLQADRPGIYPGFSAQFSGDGFSDMRFELVALSKEGFEEWLTTTRSAGGTLDAAGYAELARPSSAMAPKTFGAVTPQLFETMMKAAPNAAEMAHADHARAPAAGN
jgi:cytochrome o ubiquinol oxidase subunit 2